MKFNPHAVSFLPILSYWLQATDVVYCSNHDDGITRAHMHCVDCNTFFCEDCAQILHLRKTLAAHTRVRIAKRENTVSLVRHEDSTRLDLPRLHVVTEATQNKVLVELKQPSLASSIRKCRYCGQSTEGSIHDLVCSNEACRELARLACPKLLDCGHPCPGVAADSVCLPCLHHCEQPTTMTVASTSPRTLTQDQDDQCMICFSSSLEEEPCVQVACGHVFHFQCVKKLLQTRWNGPRVSFGFAQCPICKVSLLDNFPTSLSEYATPIHALYDEVRRKALKRLEHDGVDMSGKTEDERAVFAMNKYAYYLCFKCKAAYFGGEGVCEAARGSTEFDPSELVCPPCVGGM